MHDERAQFSSGKYGTRVVRLRLCIPNHTNEYPISVRFTKDTTMYETLSRRLNASYIQSGTRPHALALANSHTECHWTLASEANGFFFQCTLQTGGSLSRDEHPGCLLTFRPKNGMVGPFDDKHWTPSDVARMNYTPNIPAGKSKVQYKPLRWLGGNESISNTQLLSTAH
jgi:hypothetical protein